MDDKILNHFRNLLLLERDRAVDALQSKEKQEDEDMEFMDRELSSFGNHPGDIGTEVYMLEQEKGLQLHSKNILEKIEESLKDIENKRYGICIDCKKEISRERLETIPYAKTCEKCMKKDDNTLSDREFTSGQSQSPVIKPYISKENLGYDREDAYKDMLKDNIVPKDPSFSTGDNIGFVDEEENE